MRKLVWFEPFWVLIIGAPLLLPARFLPPDAWELVQTVRPWLIGSLILFWPLRWLAYGRLTLSTPLNLPLAALIAWLPVAYWASADKPVAWEAMGYLAFGLALFFACVNWPPFQTAPQRLAWLLVLLGAGMILAAPFISRLITPPLPGIGLIDAALQRLANLSPGEVNLNRTAAALSLFLPLYVSLAVMAAPGGRGAMSAQGVGAPGVGTRALFGLLAAGSAATLILTQSRGAILAAAAGVAVVVLLRWPRFRAAAPLVVLLTLVGAAGAGGYTGGGWRVAASAGNAASLGWEGRLELWSRALFILSDFPFTGSGIGSFDRVVSILYPLFLSPPGTPISHAHNLLLQVGVDLGVPGIIAYLAVLINTFLLLARVLRVAQRDTLADSPGQRSQAILNGALAAGVAGSLAAMLVHGVVDAALWGSKPAFLPWLFVALAVTLSPRSTAPRERPAA